MFGLGILHVPLQVWILYPQIVHEFYVVTALQHLHCWNDQRTQTRKKWKGGRHREINKFEQSPERWEGIWRAPPSMSLTANTKGMEGCQSLWIVIKICGLLFCLQWSVDLWVPGSTQEFHLTFKEGVICPAWQMRIQPGVRQAIYQV